MRSPARIDVEEHDCAQDHNIAATNIGGGGLKLSVAFFMRKPINITHIHKMHIVIP
jgi:hypothetical protein